MKVCRECNVEKPLSEFYKQSTMADGHLNKCKPCVKARVNQHRLENLDRIQEYDRKRGMEPKRVAARKEYIQTEAGKAARRRGSENYRKKHPMKYAANVIVNNYIRDGKLIKPSNCSVCNSDHLIDAHHDDYTKPLVVRWLCRKCHAFWHKFNEPIYE